MCVIFFYVNSNPGPDGYKLILASNRDEYYNRETCSAILWTNPDHVFGGVDLKPGREGGTWLAMAVQKKKYKVGALLNLTGEPRPPNVVVHNNNILQPYSNIEYNSIPCTKRLERTTPKHNNLLLGRGRIVADYVNSRAQIYDSVIYNQTLLHDCEKYSAFNFLSIEIGKDSEELARINLLSNMPPTLETYEEGKCYGFGNSLPSVPFEKVRYGTERFTEIVENNNNREPDIVSDDSDDKILLIEELRKLLKEKTKFWPDAELARRAPTWGEGLSSLNVHMPEYGYGSRTHTIILINSENKLDFYEETLSGGDPTGRWKTTHFERQYIDDE